MKNLYSKLSVDPDFAFAKLCLIMCNAIASKPSCVVSGDIEIEIQHSIPENDFRTPHSSLQN